MFNTRFTKKLMALSLALIMVLSFSVNALASTAIPQIEVEANLNSITQLGSAVELGQITKETVSDRTIEPNGIKSWLTKTIAKKLSEKLRSSSLSSLCSWVEAEIGYEYAVGLRNYATVIADALDEISYYADWTKNAMYQHMSGRLIDAGATTTVANRVAYAVTYIIDWFLF